MFLNRLSVSFSNSNTKRISWRKNGGFGSKPKRRRKRKKIQCSRFVCVWKMLTNWIIRVLVNAKRKHQWEMNNKQTNKEACLFLRWLSCGVWLLIKTKRICVECTRVLPCFVFGSCLDFHAYFSLRFAVDSIKARTFPHSTLSPWLLPILRLMSVFWND